MMSFIKSWTSSQHMYAGKRCNSNPISTKRSNLDGAAPLITDLSPKRREARYNCDIKGRHFDFSYFDCKIL